MASNATQLGLGVLAAGAIAVTGVLVAPLINGAPDDAPAETAADAVDAPIDAVAVPEVDTAPDAVPEQEEVAVVPQPPTLDSFYMQPDGFATIAGRAEAGQAVAIMVAGDRVADLEADSSGAFATAILLDMSDEPRRLIVLADPDGAAIASSSIMVAPSPNAVPETSAEGPIVLGAVTAPVEDDVTEEMAQTDPDPASDTTAALEQAAEGTAADPDPTTEDLTEVEQAATQIEAAEQVAAIEPDPETNDSAATEQALSDVQRTPELPATDLRTAPEAPVEASRAASVVQTAPAPADVDTLVGTVFTDPVETTPPVATAEAAPIPEDVSADASPTVLMAETDGVRVLQDGGPNVLSSIALDTITYDPSGEVMLGGRATGDGFVQVYINNKPIRTTQIEAGDWHADLPDVASGVYTLRLDEVDEEGTVVSRIETPFKREEPADVAAVMAEETARPGFDVAVRTVQPGATLWAIAQEEMGEGIMYVAVFEANRDLIRDPDLIYPGQVFRIPDLPAEN